MKKIVGQLEEYSNALDQNGYFNGSILVGYKGEVLICQGYGLANVENNVPNTPQTKYRIGSITKGFTATAILQLQEQGVLSVQDTIDRYLPDFLNGKQITIHHLLTHTSGIPDFTSFPDYWTRIMRLPSTLDQTIALFKELSLEFTPGERFSYCSSSYLLLTKIIEQLSGQSYEEYLQQYILQPLHMNNSGVDNGRTILKHMASGYTIWKEKIHSEFIDMSIPLGGYGLYSTVEDLYLWDQALYTNQLISDESLCSMFSPYQQNYGYGWAIQQIEIGGKKRTCISHYGDINGFCGDILRFVDDNLTVIVLSNLSFTPVTWIGKNIAKVFFGVPIKIPEAIRSVDLNEATIHHLLGTYQTENSNRELQITYEKGQLYLTTTKVHGAPCQYPIHPIFITEKQIEFVTEYMDESLIFELTTNTPRLWYREMDNLTLYLIK
ncbi:serine hydrolase domain-containing protein [Laceyella tengchongensis]|uniref:serine hydrolase domain-containing protein n=1 Tax=Laceyella tengchongensis TaxID=574699 RepID=UPI0012B74C45|nr:serine hydrolase [Laceyella tengchongensis]